MNPVKKLSHCYCDKLTPGTENQGWFEKLLIKLVPHFDIFKTIVCDECLGLGKNFYGEDCGVCLGNGSLTVEYLRRFYLFRSKWFGLNFGDLYLHHILRGDDDRLPHDHPWNFRTFVLKGQYREEIYDYEGDFSNLTRVRRPDRIVKAGQYLFRRAEHIHQVKLDGRNGGAWTLLFAGKYRRDWHFIDEDKAILWRDFLGVPPDVDVGE